MSERAPGEESESCVPSEVELASPGVDLEGGGHEVGSGAVRRRSFLFESVRLLATNMFHVVLFVFLGILSLRIWGLEARGQVQIALAVPSVLAATLDLGLSQALPYMIGRKTAPLDRIGGAALSLWLLMSGLGVVVCAVYFSTPLMPALPLIWMLLALATIPLELFAPMSFGFAVGVERVGFLSKVFFVRDPITVGIVALCGVGAAATLIAGMGWVPPGGVVFLEGVADRFGWLGEPEQGWIRILALGLGLAAGLVYGLMMMRRHVRLRLSWDKRLVLETFRRSFVFGLGPLCMKLSALAPATLITLSVYAVSDGDIALFVTGQAIAMLLFQLSYAVGHILMSRSVNATDDRVQAVKTARLVRVGLVVATPMAGGMAVVAPFLVPLVYGRDVAYAATVMMYLLPGVVAFFALHTFAVDLTAKGRAWLVTRVTAPMLGVVSLVLAVWTIPMYGIEGASITLSVGYVLGAGVMTVVYARATGLSLMEVCRPHRDDLEIWHRIRSRVGRGRGSR